MTGSPCKILCSDCSFAASIFGKGSFASSVEVSAYAQYATNFAWLTVPVE
jgi:hypothetical protein